MLMPDEKKKKKKKLASGVGSAGAAPAEDKKDIQAGAAPASTGIDSGVPSGGGGVPSGGGGVPSGGGGVPSGGGGVGS